MTTAATPPAVAGRLSLPLGGALRRARRRLLAQRFLDWVCACVLAAGALLLTGGGISFLCGGAVFRVGWLAIGLGAALGAALLGTAAGWIDLEGTARIVDRRAGTHDRFHTALAFLGRNSRSGFEELTLTECLRYSENFPVRRWTPILWPRAARFLAVPALALALLCWHASLRIGAPPADPALDAAIAQRAAILQTLAEKLRPADAQGKTPDLERLAAEMKRGAERLRNASAESAAAKLKGALGEISALESMLAGMTQAAAAEKASPAELAALSAALAANPQTQDAARSMQQGQLEQAAAQLEQLLQQLEKQGNAAQAMQQLAQSMQDQAAKLTEAEKNGVAKQMQQAAQAAQAGQTALSAQALQRLADLLRKLGQNGAGQPGKSSASSPGGAAPQMTQSELQNLLNALENMKAGLGDPGNRTARARPRTARAAYRPSR